MICTAYPIQLTYKLQHCRIKTLCLLHTYMDVCKIILKNGLRWTRKLRQYKNWKVNLQICKMVKASNREKWSVRLVCLADTLSWSILLIHLADFSSWLYAYYTTCIITGKAHMLQSANHKVTSNPPYIIHFPLCTSHLITLHLTHCINLSNLDSRNLSTIDQKIFSILYLGKKT